MLTNHGDPRLLPGMRSRGFTLIELMITVAIVAILAAIALPSYYQYILRSNRSAAESLMQEMASAQERYMVDARQFASSASALGYGTLPHTASANYTLAVATELYHHGHSDQRPAPRHRLHDAHPQRRWQQTGQHRRHELLEMMHAHTS